MTAKNLTLISPDVQYQSAFLDMAADFEQAGETRFSISQHSYDFAEYVHRLQAFARGEELPEGWVPSTAYWLLRDDGVILGVINLRNPITPALAHHGGHIGYAIRPSQRNRGYAKQMLALCLDKVRALGLASVIITCDADNLPSARVIEANGGHLLEVVISQQTGKLIHRYQIDV